MENFLFLYANELLCADLRRELCAHCRTQALIFQNVGLDEFQMIEIKSNASLMTNSSLQCNIWHSFCSFFYS